MELNERVQQVDSLVSQGAIVEAVKTFFAEDATTTDYGKATTENKAQMVAKMEGFAGSIAQVNGITHHKTLVDGNRSASEFTFDFDMKDGSKIYWHEIIQREWNSAGQIITEGYFKSE